MANLLHRRFKFPKGCSIQEAVLRETNGIDEQDAALAKDGRGERSSIYSELVRLSIVEVDGQKVTQPYTQMEHFNSKTRALIMRAYEQLNELPSEEEAVFLAASEDVAPALATVPKSAAEMADEEDEEATA